MIVPLLTASLTRFTCCYCWSIVCQNLTLNMNKHLRQWVRVQLLRLSHISFLELIKLTFSSFLTDASNLPPKLTTVPPPIVVELSNPFSCGGVFEKALNGSFRSPGYPNFHHDQDCGWDKSREWNMWLSRAVFSQLCSLIDFWSAVHQQYVGVS